MMAGDAIMIVISVFVSLRVWAFVARVVFTFDFILPQLYWCFILIFLWFALASANDFYNLQLSSRLTTSVQRLIQITVQLLFIYLLIFFFSSRDALPRLFIIYHAGISFVLLLLWRSWRPFLIGWSQFKRRALIIGTGWAAETILAIIAAEASDVYDIVGLISDVPQPDTQIGNKPV